MRAASATPQFEQRHRLALALEYADVTVNEIATELGVSRTTVSNWLHGRTEPRRADLVVWAMRCGVPLEWIIDGIEPPPSDGDGDGPSGGQNVTGKRVSRRRG